MKKVMFIVVLGALMACLVPANAQTMQFQSTSSMRGTGSVYTPQVSEVGATAAPSQATTTESYSPAQAPGMRKGFLDPSDPGNPSGDSPIGDALLPMLLCAVVFCGVIALRRKRSALNR